MTNPDILSRLNRWLIFIVLTIGIMVLCRPFLTPLVWAVFLALLLHPICVWLERRRIPRSLAAMLVVVTIAVVSLGLLVTMTVQIKAFASELSDFHSKFDSATKEVQQLALTKFGYDITPLLDEKLHGENSTSGPTAMILGHLVEAGSALAHIILVPVYLFFLLLYRKLIRQFIYARFEGLLLTKVLTFLDRVKSIVRLYMIGSLAVTAFLAGMALVAMLVIGVKHAFFLALLLGVLNLIPYVGNLISFSFIFLYTWVTKDSISSALILMGCFQIAHILQENVVRPWILGSKLQMNAFWVFISVIIGGTIWGISGMILFIPLTAIIKVLLELGDNTKEWAILLDEEKQPRPSA